MDSLIYQTTYLKGHQSPIPRINANAVQNKKSTVENTTVVWGRSRVHAYIHILLAHLLKAFESQCYSNNIKHRKLETRKIFNKLKVVSRRSRLS